MSKKDEGIKYFDRCGCGQLWDKCGKDFTLPDAGTIKCVCGKLWKASKAYMDNLMGKKKKPLPKFDD
jgi:hypothetical protein